MTNRMLSGLIVGLIVLGVVGCGGKDTKPSIPTELIEPPPPDKQGANAGGKKPKHSDKGENSGATEDK